ncbi:hypothetical protein N0B51_13555 [Tsuneonella sp. YG55]|uniref:Uncharacterized protein n=1 Tax=Tsuneonella litorea TaxID=2976475 RepID=A0A9X2W4C5_9SPHN|nr:hypothetical protein [Tsuneonella litorea]MCT2560004.1 hypothetical protein [Tsuneonella litorea]
MPSFILGALPELVAALVGGLAALLGARFALPRLIRSGNAADSVRLQASGQMLEEIPFDRDSKDAEDVVREYLADEEKVKRALGDLDFTIQESRNAPYDFLIQRGDQRFAVEVKSNFSRSSLYRKQLKKWLDRADKSPLPEDGLLLLFDHARSNTSLTLGREIESRRWDLLVIPDSDGRSSDVDQVKEAVSRALARRSGASIKSEPKPSRRRPTIIGNRDTE